MAPKKSLQSESRALRKGHLILGLGAGLSLILWVVMVVLSHGFPPTSVDFFLNHAPERAHGLIEELRNGFHFEAANADMPTAAFLLLNTAIWLLLILVFLGLRKAPDSRPLLGWIIGGAIVFRLILIVSVPVHENDFYRYIWDGESLLHGVNPYLHAPLEVSAESAEGVEEAETLQRLRELREEHPELHARIGHPQIPTIYPPTALGTFAMAAALPLPPLLSIRLVLLVFDVGCMLLILSLLKRLGKSLHLVILYAWSPLVLMEVTNSAHYDVMPVFFLLLTLELVLRGKHVEAVGAAILGFLGKFFQLGVMPLIYPLRPSRWGAWATAALVAGLVYLPFFLWQDAGLARVGAGLGTYLADWENNSALFAWLDQLCEQLWEASRRDYLGARLVAGGIFAAGILWLMSRSRPDAETLLRHVFYGMTLFFLLNPTAFPWYYLWVLPFVCLFPRPSWILLSGTLSAYYLVFDFNWSWTTREFAGLPLRSWITWGPFFVLWIGERFLDFRKVNVDTKT